MVSLSILFVERSVGVLLVYTKFFKVIVLEAVVDCIEGVKKCSVVGVVRGCPIIGVSCRGR